MIKAATEYPKDSINLQQTQGYPASQGYPGPQGYPGYPDAPPPPVGFQTGQQPPPPGFNASAPNYTSAYPGTTYPSGQSYPYPTDQSYPYSYPASTYPTGGQPPYAEPPPSYVSQEGGGDIDEALTGWEGFTDKAIRRSFVRKVYSILMVQLAFTTGVIALFIYQPKVKKVVQTHMYLYIISYVAFLVLYFTLICCSEVRRKWPTNIILLGLFTVALSYMVGTISSYHDTNIVLMAMGICAACCLAITIFSFNTKIDLTSCGGVLFILSFVLFMFGIITIFTYNRILNTVYAGFGALLFMLFLAYDTQMLMGGKKHQLSPEEHIFAALQIYIDVVYIFLFLLSLMGSRK